MRWVLLRLEDEAAEKLVAKAGKRAIGVWDIPDEFCDCPETQWLKGNWERDAELQRPVCKTCRKVHRVYLEGIGYRTRWAFGRNILKKLRGE